MYFWNFGLIHQLIGGLFTRENVSDFVINGSTTNSDAVSGWVLAHPEIESSDYAHHITACPPVFENLTASLYYIL